MRFISKRSRIRLAPQLSSITLDDVLSGDTCAPIGLANFETYLAHKEHAVENLRFVVWYQSYRRRFFALPAAQQKLSPGSRQFSFALPTPARTAQHISRVSTRTTALEPLEPTASPLLSPAVPLSRAPSVPLTASSSLPSRTYVQTPAEKQPFRHECMLVAATFLLPSAPYELMLPSLLPSTILRDLAFNTHPDVFLPAYEYAYDALLTSSLPRFLEANQTNVNWEKRVYWWLYGITTSCIGWAIVIGCLFINYGPNTTQGRIRAWRLLGVPFLALGAMQMYAAYRGFCSQVWGRGTMQLQPWELAWPSTPSDSPSPPSTSSGRKSRQASLSSSSGSMRKDVTELIEFNPPVVEERGESAYDTPEISRVESFAGPSTSHRPLHGVIPDSYRDTWDLPSSPSSPSLPFPTTQHNLHHTASGFSMLSKKLRPDAPYSVSSSSALSLSTRARVFGPERVVLDPRIRAVHRRVMRDLLVAGFVFGTGLTVVVLVLPHATRR